MTFALTPHAVQQADVLRRLADDDRPVTAIDALAREIERDPSNLRKTLRVLESEGLARRCEAAPGEPILQLTEAGRDAVAALDRAEGRVSLPAGVVTLRHAQIAPHPLNPRKDFESEEAVHDLDGLRESIVQRRAVRQNLEVTPPDANGVHFLVSGERRWRAVGLAIADGDLPEDFPILCVVKQPEDDAAHLFDALDENLQRRGLSPLEEGRAFVFARDQLGRSTREISEKVGRSQKHVQDRIALVEKVSPEDQARMALPKDHPDYLPYYKVREQLMQTRKPEAAKPTPPAAATPVGQTSHGLTPAQLLLLAEIAHRVFAIPAPGAYQCTEVSPAAPTDTLSKLSSYLSYTKYARNDGRCYVWLGYGGRTLLERHLSGVFTDQAETTLDQLRRAAGLLADDDAPLAPGIYATAWLNGPFEISDEGRQAVEEREAEERELAEAETERTRRLEQEQADKAAAAEAERQRGAQMLQDMRAIAEEIGRTSFAALDGRIADVFAGGGAPLPWSLDAEGDLADAQGRKIQAGGDALTARRLMIVLAVNAAAGLRTPELSHPGPKEDVQ